MKDLLKDKTAIVTGGTRGIGYAIVRKYLEAGASVALETLYAPVERKTRIKKWECLWVGK